MAGWVPRLASDLFDSAQALHVLILIGLCLLSAPGGGVVSLYMALFARMAGWLVIIIRRRIDSRLAGLWLGHPSDVASDLPTCYGRGHYTVRYSSQSVTDGQKTVSCSGHATQI